MLRFLDKSTPQTARRLLQQAHEVSRAYRGLTLSEIGAKAITDFPESERTVLVDHVQFRFPELPNLCFSFVSVREAPVLSVFGAGVYDGFVLQHGQGPDHWIVHVGKPATRRLGTKARRLAQMLVREGGVRDLKHFR